MKRSNEPIEHRPDQHGACFLILNSRFSFLFLRVYLSQPNGSERLSRFELLKLLRTAQTTPNYSELLRTGLNHSELVRTPDYAR